MKTVSEFLARAGRALALAAALLGAGAAQAAINWDNTPSGGAVTATGMELIRDTVAGGPTGQYVGLRFSSTVAVTNVYARAIVTGTGYSLDATEVQDHFIGDLSTTAKTSFWYINYPATTANGNLQVQIYSGGPPGAGGVLQGSSPNYLLRSLDSDQSASANKIFSVVINGGNPITLGQAFDAVVCYDVNSGSNVLISPAATSGFDPTGLELLGVPSVQMYGGAGCTGTLNSSASNQLYYVGSFSSNAIRATYRFRAMNSLATPLSPIVSARSGQYKYNTDFASSTLTTVPAATNTVTLAKTVNVTASPGATTVTYTLTATNSGSVAVTLDSFVDTLPSTPGAVSYATGSSLFNGVAIANPLVAGQVLTWGNPGGAAAFTIPANSSRSLTFQANIPSTAGAYTNSAIAKIGAVTIDTTLATGDNAPATAVTRVGPPVLVVTKTTSTPVVSGGIATYTVTVTNNGGSAAAGVALTDTLPSGFTYAATGPITLGGGATRTSTVDPAVGATAPAWSAFSIPSGGSVAITFDATVATSVVNGNNDNSASATTTTTPATINNFSGGTQTTDNVSTTSAVLTVAKSTSTASVNQTVTGTSATYTLSVSNSGTATATASGVALIDTLPAGFTYASHTAPVLAGGATRPAPSDPAAGETAPAWGGFTLPAGASVTITFVANVAASVPAGTYDNSASATTTTLRNTTTNFNGAAQTTDNVTVSTASLAVSKSFAVPTMTAGGVTQLTINLVSTNATTLSSVFTDTLPTTPGAMTVATPNGLGGTCAGVTATAGSGSISMAAGSAIPAGGCSITVNVTASAPGTYTNTIAAGALSTGAGTNSSPASASLIVYAPPTIAKVFSPASITVGGTSTITFTLNNVNTVALTSANFTDVLSNMSVASATIGGTCADVTNSPALAVGATALNLTIPSLPVAGCTVTVQVTSSTAGVHPNTSSGVTTTQTPTAGAASNTTSLTVMAPPTVTKTFLTNPVAKDATTQLQITIANPNSTAITGAAFTDNYPTTPDNNLVNVTPPNAGFTPASVTAGCTGTIAATGGQRSLALTGGTIPPNTTCVITVDVRSTSNTGPTYLNSTGPVTTTNAGTGAAATDTLIVVNGITVSKAFSPAQIPEGATSQMTITLGTTQGGAGTTGVAFTDTYPSGLVNVATTPVVSNSCGGTLTATPSAGSFSLSGGAIPANSTCTIVIAVTAATAGNYTNTIPAGAITSSSGPNAFGDSATLGVLVRPTVSKSFAAASIQSGGATTLTINLNNPNTVPLTLASAFTDTLPTSPGAMTVATPNNLGGTCTDVTATAGSGSISKAVGSTIPAGGCTITVNVTASAAGVYTNTIAAGALATTGAGSNTAPASADLTVYSAPTIAKAFSPATIVVNTTSTLTFTLGNGNASALSTANFTDTLANMNVASTTIGGTCVGVTNSPALAVGATALNLTVPSLPAGGCTVTVQVTSPAIGAWPNTASGVTTTQTPTAGAASNSATLTVIGEPHLVVSKTTSTPTIVNIPSGTAATYTVTVANTGTAAATGVTLSDALPAGFAYAATTSVTLNGTALATTAYTASGTTSPSWTSNPAGGFTVNAGQSLVVVFTANVAAATANGIYNNSASVVSDNAVTTTNFDGAAQTTDDVTVTSAVLTTTKTTSTPTVVNPQSGTTAIYTVTVTNDGNAAATGVKVIDLLSAGFSYGATTSVTLNGTALAASAYQVLTTGAQTAQTPQWDSAPAGGFTIDAGQTLVITFTANIAASVVNGPYNNSVDTTGVARSVGDFDGAAQTTDDVTVTSAVLTTSKTANTPTVVNTGSGTTARYTITVTNTGDGPATGVKVHDLSLPMGFTYGSTVSVTLNGAALASTAYQAQTTFPYTPNDPLWDSNPTAGFTINAGQSLVIVFDAAVHATVADGTYHNSVTTLGAARSIANFDGAANTSDNVTVTSAMLTVTKSTSTPNVQLSGAAGTATYTLTVANTGSGTATGVRVTDLLPAGFTYSNTTSVTVGGTPQTFSVLTSGTQTLSTPQWDTSPTGGFSIPAGQSLVVVFDATISATVVTGVYHNSASATGNAVSIANFDGSLSNADDVSVVAGVNVYGTVYADANHNTQRDAGEAGTGLTVYLKLVPAAMPAGPATKIATAQVGTGAYNFTGVPAGEYIIVLDDNTNLADVTPNPPAGWLGTEMADGLRRNVVVTDVELRNQNFGLFQGARLTGRVFDDNGAGGAAPNNGLQSGGEAGIASVTVRATDAAGATVLDTASTDGAGNYTLWIPLGGAATTVRIVQSNLNGYLSISGAVGTTSTTGGSYARTSDTVTFSATGGNLYSGVNFGDVRENTLSADGRQSTGPGNVVFYAHRFTPGSGGTVSFALAGVATPSTVSGFTQILLHDANCNGQVDAGEPVLALGSPQTVLAGAPLCVVVKDTVPTNAPMGATDTITLTANFTYTNASPALTGSDTNTDITTVGVASALQLHKTQSTALAVPGANIIYTIDYTNNSSSALSNIVLNDATPAFTRFVSAACLPPLPAGVTACSVTAQPAAGAAGTITWTLTGSLASAARGQVQFTVQVAQ